jgi:hypothetical protein
MPSNLRQDPVVGPSRCDRAHRGLGGSARRPASVTLAAQAPRCAFQRPWHAVRVRREHSAWYRIASTRHGSLRLRPSGAVGLLHIMWNSLDPNLQDAFSLAYNKKQRLGGNRISTKDFFQALVRLGDDSVSALIDSLPPEALPDPIAADVSKESRLVLEEKPLLSDCVADSLEHFKGVHPLPRRISSTDMFIDIARYGHGESVSRLRQHGIGKKQIEERVQKLGLTVLQSNRG